MVAKSKFAFVDLETTGTSFFHDRILEVGIIIVENGQVKTTYQTVVNPECYIPTTIFQLTGIAEEEVENAPTFNQIYHDIWDLLQGSIFVAHNARFDKGFLKSEFERLGKNFNPKTLCTVRLSRKLFPEHKRHSLDHIIERFNIGCERRHRALDDAQVLVNFLEIIHKSFPPQNVEENIKEILGEHALPPHIPTAEIAKLPEKTGVYIMYGENGFPLYIGKSVNIKERVMSHFSASLRSAKELKIFQKVETIEAIATHGEMGALFKEAELIKKMQPLYNRMLRRARKLHILKQKQNARGYGEVELMYLEKIDPTQEILGVFRSKRQAETYLHRLAKEHQLCNKLLHLEKTSGRCFNFQLKICLGACLGEEDAITYNQRLSEAFKKTKLLTWPYKGAIAVREYNENNQEGEIFFIKDWCLLGSGLFNETGLHTATSYAGHFDYDQYKILSRYLRKTPKKKLSIKVIPEQELAKALQLLA